MNAQTKEVNGANGVIRIFTDGAGCRPDGKGSGFAWLREDTNQKQIKREDNLTNNQAEYRAILSAIESLDSGANVEILTDSENTCFQLRAERRVRDPHLAQLHAQIHELIAKKQLIVTFSWISRRENLAGKLI
jgi:ribonuclease HI